LISKAKHSKLKESPLADSHTRTELLNASCQQSTWTFRILGQGYVDRVEQWHPTAAVLSGWWSASRAPQKGGKKVLSRNKIG